MQIVHSRPDAATSIADSMAQGRRRIVFQDHRAFTGPEGILPLVASRKAATLVLAEFHLIKATLAELRKATSKDEVGQWDSQTPIRAQARILVAGYEKTGLYLRFMPRDAFALLLLQEHCPENTRSAHAIVDHFAAADMIQVLRPQATPAFVPDALIARSEGGAIETRHPRGATASAA